MGSPQDFETIAKKAGISGHRTMLMPEAAVKNVKQDPKRVNGMLHALASGNTDDFVNQAKALGVDEKQAHHAVRDTAALASIVVQFAAMACW
jgi:hypothetical protein